MKKSQISLFVFTGIILIIFIVFFIYAFSNGNNSFYFGENKRVVTLSDVKIDISSYINSCIKDAASDALQDTGIREDTVNEYKRLVTSKIKACSDAFFAHLQEQQNYEITKGDININVELNDDSIKVDIDYPITVEHEGDKIDFKEFHYVFDRSVSVKIPGGVTNKEIRFTASNGKAQIVLPKGVKITDINGKPVENIGLKVEDVHFDGLENRYALGQLVYEGFPDKIFFSKPVELSIDFREEDIPEGYTKEDLMISYWDNESEIWFALPTEIKEKRAIANITHFTEYDISLLNLYIIENKLFEQRYLPTRAGTVMNKYIWWITAESDLTAGTAFLQPGDPGMNNALTPESFQKIEHYPTKDEMDEGVPIDLKETYQGQAEEFIFFPKIQYGYFEHSETPSDDEFVDCEPEAFTRSDRYDISFKLIDNKPYFYLIDGKCRNGFICSDCMKPGYSAEDIDICSDKTNCKMIDEQMCAPHEEDDIDTTDNIVPCCLEIPPSVSESSPKVFGWHNYQCAGGRVRPAEGQESSDFIIFERKGNAVISDIFAIAKPSRAYSNSETHEVGDATGVALPFYCDITEYSDIPYNDYNSLFREEIPGRARRITIPNEGYGVGIYGLDIIKKTETEYALAKTELHTQCSVFWIIRGNGIAKTNTPETFNEFTSMISSDIFQFAQQYYEAFLQVTPTYVVDVGKPLGDIIRDFISNPRARIGELISSIRGLE